MVVHAAAAVTIGLNWAGPAEPALTLPKPEAAPDLRPGIDRSRAMTINWIGFQEPTEHRAPEATTDQPALARGPAPTPAPETAAPSPASRPSVAGEVADAAPSARPLPDLRLDDLTGRMARAIGDAASRLAAAIPEFPTEAPQSTPPAEAAPTVSASAGGGPRESPPTARVKTIVIEPGKPIAAEGLVIDTVAPRFSTVTRLTASPHNPLVEVTFDATGAVVLAEIIETSRYKNVDRPVLDAVYQWRARGDRLEALRAEKGEQARHTLRFRIVLR